MQGRAALAVTWNPGDNAGYESAAYHAALGEAVRTASGEHVRAGARRATRRRPGLGRQEGGGRVSHAAPGARGHGAAGGDGEGRRRPLRVLGADAEPAGGADRGGPRAGDRRGRGDHPRHAARRGLRPQVQARLRGRGGAAGQGGRRPRARAVDARGRRASRLLPLDERPALRRRARRRGPRRRLASPRRVPVDQLDVLGGHLRRRGRAPAGRDRSAARHPRRPVEVARRRR